jgi:hypothetical protein
MLKKNLPPKWCQHQRSSRRIDRNLLAEDFSERDDAIGYQFRMLDVEWLTTPGMRIFPAGSFTSRQTLNSVKKRFPTLSRHA